MSKTLKDPNEALLRELADTKRRLEAIERRPRRVAVVRRITAQSFVGGASGWHPVSFEDVTVDTDTCFDLATDTRLTCKTAGIYLAVTNLTMTSAATHKTWFGLRINGVDFISALGPIDEAPATDKTGCATAIVSMNIGDYVESMFKHDDGTNKSLTPATGPVTFSIVMVS
jgi:hypothetical protein